MSKKSKSFRYFSFFKTSIDVEKIYQIKVNLQGSSTCYPVIYPLCVASSGHVLFISGW